MTIKVIRSGNTGTACEVEYATQDGDAKAGEDYIEDKGKLIFEAEETEKEIEIKFIDDNEFEPDEKFHVVLLNPSEGVLIGKLESTEITIINDDMPGIFEFEQESQTSLGGSRNWGIIGWKLRTPMGIP